jgi:hypothetical protein
MRKFVSSLFVSALLCSTAFAGEPTVESDYQKLSQIPAKYEVFGTICEYLAALRLEDQYPKSKYSIEVGIEYRAGGRTVGEIDVVVFRKSDKEAVAVGQVKCRKNMGSARSHANEQNERFRSTMSGSGQHSGAVTFRSTSKPDLVVTAEQMDEIADYFTAAQAPGAQNGWTMDVGHDLDTVSDMRDRLLACQGSGECPQPQ